MAKEESQLNGHDNEDSNDDTKTCMVHSNQLSSTLNTLNNTSRSSSPSTRVSLQTLSSEKKAKRIKFYVNGDRFFKGIRYALSMERTRSLDVLCHDLNRLLADNVSLPLGVRFIFSLEGNNEKINSLAQLNEGCSYVCSSIDNYINIDYDSGKHQNHNGNNNNNNMNSSVMFETTNGTNNCSIRNGNKSSCHHEANNNSHSHQASSLSSSSSASPIHKTPDFIRPKLVTVIRNGARPRKGVRILLNKKTAQTYEHVLVDISQAIQLDCGSVRRLFTLSGKQVTCLADFFSDDDIFIALGLEKFSREDLDLDPEEWKYCNIKTSLSRNAFRKLNSNNINQSRKQCRRRANGKLMLENNDSHHLSNDGAINEAYSTNGNSISLLFPKEVIRHYEIGQIIGDGNFAVVHECVHKINRMHFALKIIDKAKCNGKEAMIASEVAILRTVKHFNIVQLIEEFDYHNELYLVMELVKGGDLFDAITLSTKYTEKDASEMIYNLANALAYLHSLNIVHRDVKPENLLICEHEDGRKSLKLGDFGLAVVVKDEEKIYEVCGTPTYVAPEILAELGYGSKVDIWAAGVIAYILLCGFPPFANDDNDQDLLFDQILSGQFEYKEPFWEGISDSAKDLISNMLEIDIDQRYNAIQVLTHSWVKDDVDANNLAATNTDLSVSRKLNVNFDKKSHINNSHSQSNSNFSKNDASISLIPRISSAKKCNGFRSGHVRSSNYTKKPALLSARFDPHFNCANNLF